MTSTSETPAAPPYVPAEVQHHLRAVAARGSELNRLLWKNFTRNFATDPEPISAEQRDYLYRHGFTPEKWNLYRLHERDPSLFLSDVERDRTRRANGAFDIVFNNKILFTQVFSNYCRVPAVAAVWRDGRMIPYGDLWGKVKEGKLEAPIRLVAKPIGGGGGGSIYFLSCDNSAITVESNDHNEKRRRFLPANIERLFADARVPFMVTEFIVQGEYSRRLYPLAVNTMRVLVIRDPETLQPHVVRAVQRMGTAESYPIDNFSYGGLSAAINLDTGELGYAVAAAGPYAREFLERHPDTFEPIKGKIIPNWHKMMEDVKALFLRMPYITYCGFDLVVQDDGFSVIEGNSFSQVRLFQVHEPLLTDLLYCKFLAHLDIYMGCIDAPEWNPESGQLK